MPSVVLVGWLKQFYYFSAGIASVIAILRLDDTLYAVNSLPLDIGKGASDIMRLV